ncbi:MAG TPA: glycosyltransferase [Ignavibacteria bacterium]
MRNNKTKQDYILITSTNFPSGGAAATYLNLFCRGLKLNEYAISVFMLKGNAFGKYTYTGPRKNRSEDGIPFTYLGFKQRPDSYFLKLFEELISIPRLTFLLLSLITKRKSTNILVYNSEIQYNIPIYLITKIFRIKTTKFVAEIMDKSEFKGSFFRKIKGYGEDFNFQYFNKISVKLIVFSHYVRDEYLRMGYDSNNILVQPNLTDFEYWESAMSEAKYTLGYSGTPSIKDGLFDLFKSISLLQVMNINVTLLVIGDSNFGKSRIPALKEECEKLDIAKNVFFTGLVDSLKVKQYLSECKILCITRPSITQTKAGFPTKLGEYYATKKPILATDFGDLSRYFSDDLDIIMAECGNPESIAEKIAWMIQNNEELEVISRRGYEKAKQLLDFKSSINRIIDFLITD